MKILKKALRMSIPVVCMLALFAGPAAAFIVDGNFDASADSAALRTNTLGGVQDWYESRAVFSGGTATLLTLDQNNIGGNSTKKAALQNYGITTNSNAYLTQEFSPAQTGQFQVGFDINIKQVENSGAYDRTGLIYVGSDHLTTNAPTGTSVERFLVLAFYDPTPGLNGGSTTNDLILKAYTGASGQTYATTSSWADVATGLSVSSWYSILIALNVSGNTYDVKVGNGTPVSIAAKSDYAPGTPYSVQYLTFSADSDGRGDFYVDNVSAVPIPGAVWLLGSGLLGLVAIRRRFKK